MHDVDCASERIRSLSATEYSEPMASAKSVSSWGAGIGVAVRRAHDAERNIASRTPYRAIVRLRLAAA